MNQTIIKNLSLLVAKLRKIYKPLKEGVMDIIIDSIEQKEQFNSTPSFLVLV